MYLRTFLKIIQDFNSVWSPGQWYKLKYCLLLSYLFILRSYFQTGSFMLALLQRILFSHVLGQGHHTGSLLIYTIQKADIPIYPTTLLCTYADVSANIIASAVFTLISYT